MILTFASGLRCVYNDPRRFGVLELISKAEVQQSRWLKNLGVEPLSESFDHEMLFNRTRKRKAPIKGFIMDQRHVWGSETSMLLRLFISRVCCLRSLRAA